jgi:hypothetical protein
MAAAATFSLSVAGLGTRGSAIETAPAAANHRPVARLTAALLFATQ